MNFQESNVLPRRIPSSRLSIVWIVAHGSEHSAGCLLRPQLVMPPHTLFSSCHLAALVCICTVLSLFLDDYVICQSFACMPPSMHFALRALSTLSMSTQHARILLPESTSFSSCTERSLFHLWIGTPFVLLLFGCSCWRCSFAVACLL